MNLKVRASELHSMMTNPKTKSELLSETTKTWIKDKVKQEVFGYSSRFETPQMRKGTELEHVSLELLNNVADAMYFKNAERFYFEDWLSGTPDIVAIDHIRDMKTSWSLDTFPAFKEDAEKQIKAAGYEWQLRAYMMMCNKPKASIDYCMISTPFDDDYLKPWDNLELHDVDNIPESRRVTTVWFERDVQLENEIKERYKLANSYYLERLSELLNK